MQNVEVTQILESFPRTVISTTVFFVSRTYSVSNTLSYR